jgi:glucosamine--fructose-6-phosphate aminotransferase (isomerizing)
MCGIVGAVAQRDIVPVLLEGLKRLEYRGYDSAGVAVLEERPPAAATAGVRRLRATGRVARLEKLVGDRGLHGSIGIAHTRWATHGAPSTRNAHPHVSGGVSVVHNGIIENYEQIRSMLEARDYRFESDTDTEVIAHLVHSHAAQGHCLFDAVRRAIVELRGAYAIAVINEKQPGRMVVARMGAPLLLGLGDEENFAASDTAALLHVTKRVIYLEEGDCAEIGPDWLRIVDARGRCADRPIHQSALAAASLELGRFSHYMQKEIFEQPAAVADTLAMACAGGAISPRLFGPDAEQILCAVRRVQIIACGTSYHAGLVARYWIEGLAAVPCSVEIASEYRYRDPVASPDTLVVAISQSGETADTLAALQHAKKLGLRHSLALCNVPESALVRASTLRFLTRAGPEIGVASTKAFTTQLASLALLALTLAKLRGRLDAGSEAVHLEALRALPAAVTGALAVEGQVAAWAARFAAHRHALFLGRGVHYPIAMEGALKLKEISYIHAEAYAAGELKHGPLALVDRDMPVVAIAPKDGLFEKLKSNLQEVRARGGELYVFADSEAAFTEDEGVHVIRLPHVGGLLSPIVQVVPLQMLAYHTALGKGTDVDKPRNLAKSVTVE